MPIPIDTRKKPSSVKVHVTSGAGVDIVWSDGHASHFDFAYLRDHCPCALCNDERSKKDAMAGTMGSGAVLPMFKPKARAQSAVAVGNYAVQIVYSDGHSTGIYSFDYLRTICPCPHCASAFSSLLVMEPALLALNFIFEGSEVQRNASALSAPLRLVLFWSF